MSTTSNMPTNREWLRKLLRGEPHQVIGGPNDPYMRRWYVIPRNPLFNVYVHKFLRSDDDRALHDHPWWFVSLMLSGQYTEVTENARTVRSAPEPWRLFWGDRPLAFRRATWRHRVELVKPGRTASEVPCWTLIVTGRRTRTWGFWCKTKPWVLSGPPNVDPRRIVKYQGPDRFVPWQEFGDAGCGETA